MWLTELTRRPRRIRSKRRLVRPLGAWELYDPDPVIRREENDRVNARLGRRRNG